MVRCMANGPILIISGTNRPNSNALKVARVLEGLYGREQAAGDLLNLEGLPPEVFSPAIYTSKPAGMGELQRRGEAAGGGGVGASFCLRVVVRGVWVFFCF